ncbi:hypothetical protein GQ457_03G033600 [Hibiscus cannabinus]
MADQEIEFADKKLKIINGNEDEDNDYSDSDNDDLIGDDKTINNFISEEIWNTIGKELKDFDESDMDMLKWASIEECIEFYYTYAKVKGFGVRKGTSVKSRTDGHLILKTLMCHKQGARCEKWNNLPTRRRVVKPISRVGCLARIQFKYHEQYKIWKVQKFHAEHNHEMVKPKHVPYIRSFRKISDANQVKISSMHNSGIAPNRMMQSFVNEASSLENVGFIQKDLYNFVDKIKREEAKDGDAEMVMAYLYEFGQVLVFDTTYKCNAYNKPFVVLVGVNHHRNTVVFGCALIVNEKEDTYVWVLEQLIAAGDGYKPLTVITDRDKAMANAISKAWKELVCKHDCQDKKRAKDLYEDKEKWAEAYMQGDFYAVKNFNFSCAPMRSTQRCESMHRTLKSLLDRKVMLYRFVNYYHKELDSLRWEEGRQDYKTINEQPVCDGVLTSLKRHASRVYTRNCFTTLCKEMSYEGYYLVKKCLPHDGRMLYWLEHGERDGSWYVVARDTNHNTMRCCMKLESVGFPCRHMFAVLKYEKAKEIPQGCILKRWTIHAKNTVELKKNDTDIEGDNPAAIEARYANLASFCMNICHRASQSYETFNEVKDQFAKMSMKLQKVKGRGRKRTSESRVLGIGDPIILETGKGLHKKAKGKASSADLNMKHIDTPQLSNIAMYMPNTYKEGDISEASHRHELDNMEEDPTIFDCQPNRDW